MHKLILRHSFNALFLLFFLFISAITVGQTENDPSKFVPNIIPPSPTAYALGTYGNTPIGLFTGSQNLNIPIYTYKTANLEVPISMFYSSNGIKVDEVSSNVGQGWNLSFGGVITRVIRDKPDELRANYPIPVSMPEKLGSNSPQALDFYQYIGENDVDSESDLFSFNFGKYSGKFVFDNDGGIILMPAQEFQIQCVASDGIFNFMVIAPDGVKYYFNDKEVTTQRVIGSGHDIPKITTSTWYLSRIVHPKGDEIQFQYDDVGIRYTASRSQSYRMLYPREQTDASGHLENYTANLSSKYSHIMAIAGKAIKSIKSTNPVFGAVEFSYLTNSSADVDAGNNKISEITIKNKSADEIDKVNLSYTTTANNRVFLDKVQFKDVNQNYQFEYEFRNYLPQRLSYSQDHWGYFNNATNTNIVPKNIVDYDLENVTYNGADREPTGNASTGMLERIIYPTKGYTRFDYSNNTYFGEKKLYPPKRYGNLNVITLIEEYNKNTKDTIANVTMDQEISLVGGVSFYCPDESLNIDKNKGSFSVYDSTTKSYVALNRRLSSGGAFNAGEFIAMDPGDSPEKRNHFFSAKEGHTYVISLSISGQCTSASLSYNYYAGKITKVPANVYGGGVRISRTYDYAGNGANPVVKTYYYAKKSELGISTGDKGQTPYYIDHSRVDRWLDPPGPGSYGVKTSTTYLNLSSSSLVSLFDTGNSSVYYKYVTIAYGEDAFSNGGEEHEFIIHRDVGGYIFGYSDIRSAPLTNVGWDNGMEKRVDYFNKDLKTVKEIINTYEEKTEFRKEVIGYSTRKNYEKLETGPVNYICTAADISKRFEDRRCTANHTHQRAGSLINNLSGGTKRDNDCIAPGNNNVTQYIDHPCYHQAEGTPITYLSNIDHLSVVSYKNISFWHYLKSSKEIVYDPNGLNPISTVTDYSYKGINHVLLSSQTTKNSKNETIETKYFYAKDSEMTDKPFVTELVANNIVGIPLDTQMYKAGTKLSEQLTIYDKSTSTGNLLLPKSIYTAKFPNILPDIANVGTLEKKITFDQYDDKGNVIQYTLESGTPVTIIWGYNKTQPIAKIENATYSDVSGYVSNLQTKSDGGTETELITNLNSLRAALPNALVTTYTYKPLIGISTITDPKENTTTYLYDDFNRLKTVKDGQGNIVSENQYHYKK